MSPAGPVIIITTCFTHSRPALAATLCNSSTRLISHTAQRVVVQLCDGCCVMLLPSSGAYISWIALCVWRGVPGYSWCVSGWDDCTIRTYNVRVCVCVPGLVCVQLLARERQLAVSCVT